MNKKSIIIAIIVILVIVGGLYIGSVMQRPKGATKTIAQNQKTDGYPVEIVQIGMGDIEKYVNLTGAIDVLGKQIITSKVSGKVAKVNFREGDTVRAGQVILTLEQDTYRNDLRSAEMDLAKAKANLSKAITDKKTTFINNDVNIQNAKAALKSKEEQLRLVKLPYRSQEIMQAENSVESARLKMEKSKSDYNRYNVLYKNGAVALSELETKQLAAEVDEKSYNSAKEQLNLLKEQGRSEDIAKAKQDVNVALQNLRNAEANATSILMKDEEIKIMQAAVNSAVADVNTAKNNLANTKIISKINGVMSSRNVEPGMTISPGVSLGEIVSNSQMFYLADLSEIDVKNVKVGQEVVIRVDAFKDKSFKGSIGAIYPVADSVTRMYPVRVVLSYNPNIKSGMFAKGRISTGTTKDILLVPNSAIITKNGSDFVYKSMDKNTRVEQCTVNVVNSDNNNSQIELLKNTLEPGDFIVTVGKENLADESKIYLKDSKE